MSVLIIADHDSVSVKPNLANCIEAASKLKGDIDILIAGNHCRAAAEQAAKYNKIAKVFLAESASLEHQLAEEVSQVILSIADRYDYIMMPASTSGKNILPRVGAKLDVQPLSDIMSVESEDTFTRPCYAGNVIATVQSLDSKKILSIRTTAFDSVSTSETSVAIEDLPSSESVNLSSFVKEELAKSDRPELTAARVVVSGGRGLQNGENFELLYKLADKLGAAVGASRAAVDAGFVPNDMQVGQTGKIVAPDLYIAVGISGAIQHLAGMKDSKVIVAINKDEDAPIFQVADYGLVADLFDVIPELDRLI